MMIKTNESLIFIRYSGFLKPPFHPSTPTVEPTSFLVANLICHPWKAVLDVGHWWCPFRNPSVFFTASIPSPPFQVREHRWWVLWMLFILSVFWKSQTRCSVQLLGTAGCEQRGQAWKRGSVCSASASPKNTRPIEVSIDWPGNDVWKGQAKLVKEVYKCGPLRRL